MDNIIIEESKQEDKKRIRRMKIVTSHICRECKIEKQFIDLVVSHEYGPDKELVMKKLCLECQKNLSKKYYKEKKVKILKEIKTKYDNNKNKFNIQIKFNDINDFDNKIKIIREKLENDLISEIKQRKTYVKRIKNVEEVLSISSNSE